VSQIPALLISTASGIVVTRVASEDEGAHLGRDIGAQVLAHPRALVIASGLLVLLALVPGLPAAPLLLLGLGLGAIVYATASRRAAAARGVPSDAGGEAVDMRGDLAPLGDGSLLELEVGPGFSSAGNGKPQSGPSFDELVGGLRQLLYDELGFVLPGVRVREQHADLSAGSYRILLAGTPVAEGQVDPGRVLVLAEAAELAAIGMRGARTDASPGVASPSSSVPREQLAGLEAHGFETVDAATQVVTHLATVAREHAGELVGIQEAQELLDALERTHPALVHEVVPRVVNTQTLADVLSRLLREGVSVRDLRGILQSLAEWGASESDPVVLTEHARVALRRHLSHRYAGPEGQLSAYLLDPAIEDVLREAVQRTAKGSYLALEPELGRDIIEAVRRKVDGDDDDHGSVLLTSAEVRRYVRRLLEVDLAALPVLSYSELLPEVRVRPIARIAIEATPAG
jgi:type III secretion protein V